MHAVVISKDPAMRIEAKIGLISLSVIIIAAACGGRSGTEIFGYDDRIGDASTGGNGGSGASTGTGGGIVEGGVGGTGGVAEGGTGGSVTGGTGGGVAGTGGDIPDADIPDVSADTEPPLDAASDAQDFFDSFPLPLEIARRVFRRNVAIRSTLATTTPRACLAFSARSRTVSREAARVAVAVRVVAVAASTSSACSAASTATWARR